MPVLSDVRSVAANSTVENILSGKTQEFLANDSGLRIGITGGGAGMFCTILIGDQVIVDDQETSSATNFPIDPDDFYYEGGGLAKDRLVIKLRNSTGGALTARTLIKITPTS